MTEKILEVTDLRVKLGGTPFQEGKEILKGIGFEARAGRIHGFLGPNGAGKTTCIKSILGLIPAYEGQIRVLGQSSRSPAVRQAIGYAPENAYFSGFLTPREVMLTMGALSHLSSSESQEEGKKWCERLGIAHVYDQQIRTFSKGMKQRLALAQALIHRPRLLILDEPSTGLDPIGKDEVKKLLLELKEQGFSVFLSSHHLLDAEEICDEITILHQGEILVDGSLGEVLPKHLNLEKFFIQTVMQGREN